jgi:hypothetical protein
MIYPGPACMVYHGLQPVVENNRREIKALPGDLFANPEIF